MGNLGVMKTLMLAMALWIQQPPEPLPVDPANEAIREAGRCTSGLERYRFDIRVVVEGIPEVSAPLLAGGTFDAGSGVRGYGLVRGINQDFCWRDGRFVTWDLQASCWRPRQAPAGAPLGAFSRPPHEELADIVAASTFSTLLQKQDGPRGRLRVFEATLDPKLLPQSIIPAGVPLPPKGMTAEARLVADDSGAIRTAGLTISFRSDGRLVRIRRDILLSDAGSSEAAIPDGPTDPFRSAE